MASNYLVLENGSIMEGESFGYEGDCTGEVVFTTCAGGYQEIMTDPAQRGSILVYTYPLIGNAGVTSDCDQSDDVQVRGIVVKEYCTQLSPMYKGAPVSDYLREHKIPAIAGIDTRALTLLIREGGVLRGAIVTDRKKAEDMAKKLSSMTSSMDDNLVSEVSVKKMKEIKNKKPITVGVLDCGAKYAVIEQLSNRFNVIQFPYDTPAKVIIDSGVKGLVVSDGPGNPAIKELSGVSDAIKEVSKKMPVMGLGLGGCLTAIAFGAETVKMKFGHRGENQPVKIGGRILMTFQNHGYEVDEKSLKGTGLIADEININDKSIDGLKHESLPVMICMYHPEAFPGPDDTMFKFDEFEALVKEAAQ